MSDAEELLEPYPAELSASPSLQRTFHRSNGKNALNTIFDKTKDVLSTAAETTKGYASQAQQAIGKIIPGASQDHDPAATGAPAQPTTDPAAPAPQ
ncbi:hypothetical protein RB195_012925 [Necator americanus]|uniref:Uncharacterized protein n=1 Tax=Necator americanus TaxID=51031 RepID=A0ABR1DUE5_NECAM